ncbi:NAD(P)-binding domain-containing protein [Pseudonocardia xishanensis]|uniref:Pyrroline-5-carboxylate reductase catalytic N-terminal domain-containing protein n=1 Tax=Pseudonocardia xishanensis TaxID=630995 RepID=A0ABP8RZW7_9PSEU
MTTIAILGAGEVGNHLARAAVAKEYSVVIANSPGPETLSAADLSDGLLRAEGKELGES